MNSHPPIYGFDLIASSAGDSIDPLNDEVVAVGISTDYGDELYEGNEAEVIQMVDARIAMLDPGIITCWQGSHVAIPFLSCRAEKLGLHLGLSLHEDQRIDLTGTVAGIVHPWLISWHGHSHLDLQKVYEAEGRRRLSLRSRVDPESLIPKANPLANRDPERNARLARSLAERRWSQAKRLVDQIPDRLPAGSVLASLGASAS